MEGSSLLASTFYRVFVSDSDSYMTVEVSDSIKAAKEDKFSLLHDADVSESVGGHVSVGPTANCWWYIVDAVGGNSVGFNVGIFSHRERILRT